AISAATLAYLLAAPFVGALRKPAAVPLAPAADAPRTAGSGRGVWLLPAPSAHAPGAPEPAVVSPEALPAGDARIAVALEMGGGDTAVIAFLESMPVRPGAEVMLAHVVESAAGRYLGAESSDLETRAESDALAALGRRLQARGLAVRVVLGHGDAASEL